MTRIDVGAVLVILALLGLVLLAPGCEGGGGGGGDGGDEPEVAGFDERAREFREYEREPNGEARPLDAEELDEEKPHFGP